MGGLTGLAAGLNNQKNSVVEATDLAYNEDS